MKRRVEMVKVIKKTTATTMAATTMVGSIGILPQAISSADVETSNVSNLENGAETTPASTESTSNIEESKVKEVGVTLYKSDGHSKSMAADSLYKNAFVEEKDGKYIYTIYFKPKTVFFMSAGVTEVSVFADGFESKLTKAEKVKGLNSEYNVGFRFERDTPNEKVINVKTVSFGTHDAKLVFDVVVNKEELNKSIENIEKSIAEFRKYKPDIDAIIKKLDDEITEKKLKYGTPEYIERSRYKDLVNKSNSIINDVEKLKTSEATMPKDIDDKKIELDNNINELRKIILGKKISNNIATAEAVDKSLYTDESVKKLEDSLNKAKAIEIENSSIEDLEKVNTELESSIQNLAKKAEENAGETNPSGETSAETNPSGETSTETNPSGETSTETNPSGETSTETNPSGETSAETNPSGETSTETKPSGETSTETNPSGETSAETKPSGETSTETNPSGETSTETNPSGETSTETNPSGETDEPNTVVDKNELFSILREGRRYDLKAYKPESTIKLQSALSEGDKVYSDTQAKKEAVDSAIEKIKEGIKALEIKDDNKTKEYNIKVNLIKSGTNELSMANNAVDHNAKIIESDGKIKVVLTFIPLKLMGLEGHLLDMIVNGQSVKVEERDSKGNVKKVSFEISEKESLIPAKVEVDAMNALNGGNKTLQDVGIGLDWSNSDEKNEPEVSKQALEGDVVDAVYKNEGFDILVKEGSEDKLVDKVVVQIPKKSPKRKARSLAALNTQNMENITFIKKDNNWIVSDDDKDKIKDFKVENRKDGKLEIKFSLSDHMKEIVNTSKVEDMKVTTLDKKENILHTLTLSAKSILNTDNKSDKTPNTTVVVPNPNGTEVVGVDLIPTVNPLDESKVEILGELAKDNNAKYLTYNVEVTMMKVGTNEESMSKNSVDKIASVVEKDGMSEVTMTFKPMKFMGLEGHLLKMTIGGKEVKVVEKDDKGRPTKVSFVVKGHPKRITAEVEVDAMNELNGGKSAPQKVDIVLSWDKKTNVKEGTLGEETSSNKTRLAGANRIETSIAISKKYFNKADNVVLVSATNLADALISSPYAKMKNAPTLLTDKEGLSESLVSEIKRLGVKNITIIGGVNSVSDKVVEELKALGINVERIAGENRYETSEKVANEVIKNTKSKKIAVVNGEKNADALSVSSLATKEDMPIVMVRNNVQDKSLAQKITGWNIFEVVAVGGENSISKSTLSSIFSKEATRIAGANRYETAVEVAKKSYPQPESVFVTNGETMVDALSAGAVTYKEKAPIVLVEKDSMSSLAKEFTKTAKNIIIVGGVNSVSDNLN